MTGASRRSRVWRGELPTASLRAVQYLHACTAPADRVVVFSYQPELLPLADRRFGGGGASLVPGLLALNRYQQAMVERWRDERVPIVLAETGLEGQQEMPLMRNISAPATAMPVHSSSTRDRSTCSWTGHGPRLAPSGLPASHAFGDRKLCKIKRL